ncbi:hypothetical protein J6590_026554 [Homalodisca vitripennis]|nr:hypothetical protein J6590_026554 [Homalodisca vitripennis]
MSVLLLGWVTTDTSCPSKQPTRELPEEACRTEWRGGGFHNRTVKAARAAGGSVTIVAAETSATIHP